MEADLAAQEHLETLITSSGLTKSAYARDVMRCDPRTLRRWLSGERQMQPRTLAWIDAQIRSAGPASGDAQK